MGCGVSRSPMRTGMSLPFFSSATRRVGVCITHEIAIGFRFRWAILIPILAIQQARRMASGRCLRAADKAHAPRWRRQRARLGTPADMQMEPTRRSGRAMMWQRRRPIGGDIHGPNGYWQYVDLAGAEALLACGHKALLLLSSTAGTTEFHYTDSASEGISLHQAARAQ